MPKDKSEKKPVHLTRYIDDKYIIESIYHNKTPKYAIVNGVGPEIKGFAKPTSDLWLQPFSDPFDNLSKNVVILPTDIEDYVSEENLLQDIKTFISSFAYMPDFWLNISSYYVLMSWIYDKFGAVPYLEFIGDRDSGKTRMADTIVNCCYSSIIISGASTIAPMFRLIDRYRGTMFIDEADYKESELDSMIAKILNVGYRRGGIVWRAEKYDGDWESKAYDVYGPKIITHRKEFGDDATSSRCLTFKVPKVFDLPSIIPSQLLPDGPFEKTSRSIRNKALKWRFDNIRTIKPDMTSSNLVSNRYREISIPMMTIIKDTSFRKLFIEFLSDTAKEVKSNSHNAICVQVIAKHYRQYKGIGIALYLQGIADDMNILMEDDQEKKWTGKAVGSILNHLGLKTKKGGKQNIYRIEPTDENNTQLLKLFHEYGEAVD